MAFVHIMLLSFDHYLHIDYIFLSARFTQSFRANLYLIFSYNALLVIWIGHSFFYILPCFQGFISSSTVFQFSVVSRKMPVSLYFPISSSLYREEHIHFNSFGHDRMVVLQSRNTTNCIACNNEHPWDAWTEYKTKFGDQDVHCHCCCSAVCNFLYQLTHMEIQIIISISLYNALIISVNLPCCWEWAWIYNKLWYYLYLTIREIKAKKLQITCPKWRSCHSYCSLPKMLYTQSSVTSAGWFATLKINMTSITGIKWSKIKLSPLNNLKQTKIIIQKHQNILAIKSVTQTGASHGHFGKAQTLWNVHYIPLISLSFLNN